VSAGEPSIPRAESNPSNLIRRAEPSRRRCVRTCSRARVRVLACARARPQLGDWRLWCRDRTLRSVPSTPTLHSSVTPPTLAVTLPTTLQWPEACACAASSTGHASMLHARFAAPLTSHCTPPQGNSCEGSSGMFAKKTTAASAALLVRTRRDPVPMRAHSMPMGLTCAAHTPGRMFLFCRAAARHCRGAGAGQAPVPHFQGDLRVRSHP